MRRIATAITAAALSLSMALGLYASVPAAAVTGYDSAYQFESAFLDVAPGATGTFSVFFANTGTTSWVKGTASQVNLVTCLDDKVSCNVPPEEAAWALNWLSATAYATHTKDTVTPGDFSAFTYTVKAPANATGTARFNGDLALASTGERLHPEGYFQDARVPSTTPPPAAGAITVSPDFPTANDKMNQVSTTVPGTGQHTVTFQTALTGTLSFAMIGSANATRNADGTFGFCDVGQDKKADIQTNTNVVFTAINGRSITATNTIINEPIPTGGTVAVTIDSAIRNQRVRVIAWQDKNNNGQVDLTGSGDTDCDAFTAYDLTTDGAAAVSGRKFYSGPEAVFGTFNSGNCNFALRHSTTLQAFTAGAGTGATATSPGTFSGTSTSASGTGTAGNSERFDYDANDVFKILGTPVTLAQFKSELTALSDGTGDGVVISYNPDPAGISEFNICSNRGSDAPGSITAATGNFDSGTTANDVRLTFQTPVANAAPSSYHVQRSFLGASVTATTSNCTLGATAPSSSASAGTPADTTFTTVGTLTADNDDPATFTNFDLTTGGWCFRVIVTNPVTGAISYSNYSPVNTPGSGDTTGPLSLVANLSVSSGFANTLDTGDKLVFGFNEQISLAAGSIIRFTDSDCGAATNAGPATCTGGQTNTVGDIVCGTNATCEVADNQGTINVTMNSAPVIISAGSTAGLQYPIVVTDAQGITDLSGNLWNFAGSTDRLITNP